MNTLFLTCAALGGVILIAQTILGFFGADGHGDHDAGAHHDTVGDGLQLFSIRALSAGVAFFGIAGLGASAAGLPGVIAGVAGSVAGIAAMVGVAWTMRSMLRLEHDGSIDIQRAIGVPARVYLPIPASQQGVGKVTLALQGRTVEYQAVTSEGEVLPTGAEVLIVEVRSDDTVEVVPLPSIDGVQ